MTDAVDRSYDTPAEALVALERVHGHTRRVALARGVDPASAPTARVLPGTVPVTVLDREGEDDAPGLPGPGGGGGPGPDPDPPPPDPDPDPPPPDPDPDPDPVLWAANYNLGGPAAGSYSTDAAFLVTDEANTGLATTTETISGDDAPPDVLRTERYAVSGGVVEWAFPVEPDLFRVAVELVLVESFVPAQVDDGRLMNVTIDGDDYFREVDTFEAVGAYTAQVLRVVLEPDATDTVTIRLTGSGNSPRAQAIRLMDAVNEPVTDPLGAPEPPPGGGGTTQPPTDQQALFEAWLVDNLGADWRNSSRVDIIDDASPSNRAAQVVAAGRIALCTTSRQHQFSRTYGAPGGALIGEVGTVNVWHASGQNFGLNGSGGQGLLLANGILDGQNLSPGSSDDGIKACWAGHRVSREKNWRYGWLEYGPGVMSGLKLTDGSEAVACLNTGSRRSSMQFAGSEGETVTVREHLAIGAGTDRRPGNPRSFTWAQANPHLAVLYEGWHMSVCKVVGPDAIIDGLIGIDCPVSTLWFDYSRSGIGTVNRVAAKGRSGGPAAIFWEASGPGTMTNVRVPDGTYNDPAPAGGGDVEEPWFPLRLSSSYGVDLSRFLLDARGQGGASLAIGQQYGRLSAAGPRELNAGRPAPISIRDGHVEGGVFVRHAESKDQSGNVIHPVPGHVRSRGPMAYQTHQNVTTEQGGNAHRAAFDTGLNGIQGPLPGWTVRSTPVDPPAPVTVECRGARSHPHRDGLTTTYPDTTKR